MQQGQNITKGTLGWGRTQLPIRILVDTGSDLSFISKRVSDKLAEESRVFSVKPVTVRLTDGTKTQCDRARHIGLQIGSFRAYSSLRELKWDAYDVILGMDWLNQHEAKWDISAAKLIVRNGRGVSHALTMRSDSFLDPDEASLSFIGYKAARKEMKRQSKENEASATLYLIRQSPEGRASNLPEIRNPRFQRIAQQFEACFREELPMEYPESRSVKHEIDTGDSKPINIAHYPLAKQHRDEQDRQVRQLLSKRLVRPSASPWGFPVLFVPKPDGTWRMCIDYRLLNNVTKKDGYPLPRIQDCLDTVAGARYLSKIDLTSGYWQIEMDKDSVAKTAFNTRSGKYEFLVMPFGLCNAPATFQRIMNDALREYLYDFVVVYLDDIVVFSNSEEEHEKHLRIVFETLQKHQLYARPSKCLLGASELDFCGHIVGNGRIRPQPQKIEVIRDWPIPINVHEVRQFLGLATYYRRFIRGFARMSTALSDLLVEADVELRKKKFRPIRWTPTCQIAFDTLKRALISEPVLRQVNESKAFVIETDCSEWALGCALYQEDEAGRLHPVAFDGRKLNGAELNYPVHEKELLAIKHALRTWSAYVLNGTITTIYTDHESLKYLKTTRTPSKRLARWIAEFSEYQLDIKYRKGSDNIAADAISRRPDFKGKGPANLAWVDEADTTDLNALQRNPLDDNYAWESNMKKFVIFRDISKVLPEWRDRIQRDFGEDRFQVHEDRLFFLLDGKYPVPYIAEPFRMDFLRYFHESYGHFSTSATIGLCRNRGWWNTLEKDLGEFAKRCITCQYAQRPKKHQEQPYTLVRSTAKPFEKWGIDFVGPLPETPNGNRWILTAIDHATGWPLAKATQDATEETVADFLMEVYTQFGAFRELLSDNGANLTASTVESFLEKLRIKHRTTTPYHPQTNGKTERLNGMLGGILTKMLIDKPIILWDEFLNSALFACRTRTHSVTKMSPFKLIYGVEPRLFGDEPDLFRTNVDFAERLETVQTARHEANRLLLEKATRTLKARAIHHSKNAETFEEGDWVLLRNEKKEKLHATHLGPFRIFKKLWFGTYLLETGDERVFRKLTHGSRLTKVYGNDFKARKLMTAAYRQALNRMGDENPIREADGDVLDELNKEEPRIPAYRDLSLMSKAQWIEMDRTGVRKLKVGEGQNDAERTISNRKRRARTARSKNPPESDRNFPQTPTYISTVDMGVPVVDKEVTESIESNSPVNLRRTPIEEVPPTPTKHGEVVRAEPKSPTIAPGLGGQLNTRPGELGVTPRRIAKAIGQSPAKKQHLQTSKTYRKPPDKLEASRRETATAKQATGTSTRERTMGSYSLRQRPKAKAAEA